MRQVIHHPKTHCFTVDLNGQLAKLEYRFLNQNTVEFMSTHVPFSLRGHGFGAKLVQAGLRWARTQGLIIESRCWYVDRFLEMQVAS